MLARGWYRILVAAMTKLKTAGFALGPNAVPPLAHPVGPSKARPAPGAGGPALFPRVFVHAPLFARR